MSDEPALLAAILAQPDEDTPRLVYADWLQEQGQDARAEFIRVQVANALDVEADTSVEERHFYNGAVDLAPGVPDGWHVYRRVPATLESHPGPSAFFARGFAAAVKACAADWLQHGDAICAAHPVTAVRLTTLPHIVIHPTAVEFDGDPRPQMWTHTVVRAEMKPDESGALPAMLRLRFGRRITFTLPEGTT